MVPDVQIVTVMYLASRILNKRGKKAHPHIIAFTWKFIPFS